MKLLCGNGHEYKTDKVEPRPDELTCDCGSRRGTPSQMRRHEIPRVSEKRAASDEAKGRKRYSTARQSQPKRDWSLAREKVELEGACRFCGKEDLPENLQACHTDGRERDGFDPVTQEPRPQPWVVEPDRIVPGHDVCHGDYDAHRGDGLLGKLTLAEEVQVVRDQYPTTGKGRSSGISLSLRRLAPGCRLTENEPTDRFLLESREQVGG